MRNKSKKLRVLKSALSVKGWKSIRVELISIFSVRRYENCAEIVVAGICVVARVDELYGYGCPASHVQWFSRRSPWAVLSGVAQQ